MYQPKYDYKDQPKYDYKAVIQDLKDHNVDIKDFQKKCQQMSGGEKIDQAMFEFIYECLVLNNYNMNLFQ